jgi:hypothetical protein
MEKSRQHDQQQDNEITSRLRKQHGVFPARLHFLPFTDTCIAHMDERFIRHKPTACQLSAILSTFFE